MNMRELIIKYLKRILIAIMLLIMIYPVISLTEITSCGSYTIENDTGIVALDNINITDGCLYLNLNNATLTCDRDIVGNYGVFAYIQSMNNSIIEYCNMSTFIQGFLIPDSYYIVGYTENNIFRNIRMTSISSALFGFDIRAESGQYMNHTEFYDNYVESCYDNQAFSFYASGMDDLYIHHNTFNGTYSGIIDYYSTNIEISNNDLIGGTIYGISLIGVNNPVLRNNYIENYAVCGIALNGVNNAFLYNNVNDLISPFDNNQKFCLGEYASTIDILSSYNLGWFTDDYTATLTYSIDDLSLYNGSESYDVVTDTLVYNATKSYFIFPQCVQDWNIQPTACIDGIQIKYYVDENYCDSLTNLPADNNTYAYCSIGTTDSTSEDIIILGILFLLLVISLACAVSVHESFFGLCSLITGLMLITIITYDYPQMLIIPLSIMILLFAVMWLVIHKARR